MNESHYPTYPAPWAFPPRAGAGVEDAEKATSTVVALHPPRVSPEMLIAQLEARIVLLEATVRRLERLERLAHSHAPMTYGGITKAGI